MALPNFFLFGGRHHDAASESRDGRRGPFGRVFEAANSGRDAKEPSQTEMRVAERRTRDTHLVLRLRDGDAEAFTTLFRVYYGTLVRFLRRYLENLSDAEDVAQEIMVQLWERRSELDPTRSLQTFLFVTGRNRAIDLLRRRRSMTTHVDRVQTQQSVGDELAVSQSPEEMLLADELHHVVARHVAQLSPRQREIFQLSRDEGLSPAEIGELLGIATQTVYVQLSRVTKVLYEALDAWLK